MRLLTGRSPGCPQDLVEPARPAPISTFGLRSVDCVIDGRLRFVGPRPGAWLQDELTTLDGTVRSVVPGSYVAFARVLHRIDPAGQAIRWSQVCAASGAVAHSLMQWWPISRDWAVHSSPPEGRSSCEDPEEGNLDPISMAALYDVLANMSTAAQAFHGFWAGWGGLHQGSVARLSNDGQGDEPPASAFPFPPQVVNGPTLDLPGRDYLVFSGSLDPTLFAARPGSSFWPQSPSLSWPDDHSWCVATDIDFDSTLVAGSVELIAAVLAHPGLEAWPVTAEDLLTFDADLINTP